MAKPILDCNPVNPGLKMDRSDWEPKLVLDFSFRIISPGNLCSSFFKKVIHRPLINHFLAEFRRSAVPLSGDPYSYREEKETHEFIFSRLSWLAVLLVGVYAWQRWGSRVTWQPYSCYKVELDMHTWSKVNIFWYWTSTLWLVDTCQRRYRKTPPPPLSLK